MSEQSLTRRQIIHIALLAGAVLHALLVIAQPILAGRSLEGDARALELHAGNGYAILTVATLLVLLAIVWWRPGRGPGVVPILAAVTLAAEGAQYVLGDTGLLSLHLPLGIAILVLSLLLCWIVTRHSPRTTETTQHPRADDTELPNDHRAAHADATAEAGAAATPRAKDRSE
ncbi:hypothetical protein ACFXKG_40925 [Streptomyces sp. NPDC059255]|uniref:hypothetical protein n=1 Tax=Streptomyces sp. NPDC059255 TaxID=3346793 RepID=UPI003693CBE0